MRCVYESISIYKDLCSNYIHQSHDVISQVPGQVRGDETRQPIQSHAGVVHVLTAHVLQMTDNTPFIASFNALSK